MSTSFGVLLRRARITVNLSQEALAEASQISTSAIGTYERGITAAPHQDTVEALADALGLSGKERVDFKHASRRKVKLVAQSAASAVGLATCQRKQRPWSGAKPTSLAFANSFAVRAVSR